MPKAVAEARTESLPLDALVAHPKNSNVVSDETLAKIQKNIARTKLYPPLIVRPLSEGRYQILDGHHRKIVLERLGFTLATCAVWPCTEREGEVFLATLNTLRGTEDLRRRAALISDLAQTVPLEQLAGILPESLADLQDLQRRTLVDLDALDVAQRDQAQRNEDERVAAVLRPLDPLDDGVG